MQCHYGRIAINICSSYSLVEQSRKREIKFEVKLNIDYCFIFINVRPSVTSTCKEFYRWHKSPREKGLFSQFVCVWWPWPRSWEQESGQSLATSGAVERPQNPLCWLSKGFRCRSQKATSAPPPSSSAKNNVCVLSEEFLHRDAVIKMLVSWL